MNKELQRREINLLAAWRAERCGPLDQIIESRGQPEAIRCDNGPEFTSAVFLGWAKRRGIRIEYIQPGKPQQNAYVERYNRTVRYDWLGQHLFDSIEQVQDLATRWLWAYNLTTNDRTWALEEESP